MRAQYDNSRVERVRCKIAKLKKNLRIAENKLREARESLLAYSDERLQKALGFRWRYERQVKSQSVVTGIVPVFLPCWSNAVLRLQDRVELRNIGYSNTRFTTEKRYPKHHPVINDRCNTIVKKELLNSSKSSDTPLISLPSCHQARHMTLKVSAARNKSDNVRIKFKTLRDKLHHLEAKISRAKTRAEKADSSIKVLKERLNLLGERAKAYEATKKYRRESMARISDLEKGITSALNKAIAVENAEGLLETRVLEIEDSIEVYNMKIQRAQNVLCRLNQGKMPANTYTVTMVLRRISLSSQISLKQPSPLLLQAACCEDPESTVQ